MTALVIFFGWVMIWFRPDVRTFSLFGLLVVASMAVGALVAGALIPAMMMSLLKVWTIYLAVFLIVGAAILTWRKGK